MYNINKEENKRIAIGTLSLTVTAIIVKIIGVIYKIPLSYALGDEGMGYFNTAYTLYGFIYVAFASGLPKSVLMLIAKREEQSRQLTRFLCFFVGISLLTVTIILCLFSGLIAGSMGNASAKYSIMTISPCVFLVGICGVIKGYLNYKLELVHISVSQLIEALGKLSVGILLAFLGIKAGLPLEVISALTIGGITVGTLASALYLAVSSKICKKSEKIRQKRKISKKLLIKEMLVYSVPLTVGASFSSVIGVYDMLLILRYCKSVGMTQAQGAAVFGNYSTLVQPMLGLGLSLVTPLCVSGLAIMNGSFLRGDTDSFNRSFSKCLRLAMFICAPLCALYFIFPFETLDFIFSREQSLRAYPYLGVSCFSLLFLSLQTVFNTVLEAKGKLKECLLSLGIASLIKIGISSVLIFCTDLGLYSVCISAIVGDFVGATISAAFSRVVFSDACAISFKALLIAFVSMLVAKGVYLASGGGVSFLFIGALSCIIYVLLSAVCNIKTVTSSKMSAKYTK